MIGVRDIYIIGDKIGAKQSLLDSFTKSGFTVKTFINSKEFYANKSNDFKGLYIIDWDLSDEPGIEIVSNIRKKDQLSSIFMFSDYTEIEDRLEALNRGADDYFIKPVNVDEIFLKARNGFKRLSLFNNVESTQEIRLLPEASSFIRANKTVSLTKREFIIFNHLYSQLDKPVSRGNLISQFSEEKMTDRNIDVHIFSLRKKIKAAEVIINTVWGMGYKLSF